MKEEICENCGHVGSWHSDGTYTHTGACNIQLNDEKDDVNKMVFCGCKKFVRKLDKEELTSLINKLKVKNKFDIIK